MNIIQCNHCQTRLREFHFAFGLEEWETQPEFCPMDSDESISYCPGCGCLLAVGNWSDVDVKEVQV